MAVFVYWWAIKYGRVSINVPWYAINNGRVAIITTWFAIIQGSFAIILGGIPINTFRCALIHSPIQKLSPA